MFSVKSGAEKGCGGACDRAQSKSRGTLCASTCCPLLAVELFELDLSARFLNERGSKIGDTMLQRSD